jgi:uncharacterized protein involved in oxidation of intracellular sulfur
MEHSMKKTILSLSIILLFLTNSISAQFNVKTEEYTPTSIGMVIYSNDVETVWNAFRLANYSVKQGDTVQVFLLAKGVEVDELVNDNEDYAERSEFQSRTFQGCFCHV